ncbi:MAG: PilN domain-containing protein [Candidatus Sedimenticola endophacoides]
MARINLLPWRENLRKKQQRDFGVAAVFAILLTAAGCAGVFFYVEGMIDQQRQRNQFLQREIAVVEAKLKEIEDLEKTKAKLIARMNVIQELQTSRPEIVHLFDELVATIPEGVHLVKLSQSGAVLTLDGEAQSNARVSTYMRNIEASKWIGDAALQVITAQGKDGAGQNKFILNAKQVSMSEEAKK